MAKHIGIVACSAEGAALCYRTICSEASELMGRYEHPDITMHTFSFAAYVRLIEAGDWQGVADLMVASANKVAETGADFAICPDNTIHQPFDSVAARSPIPWLHIAGAVADEAKRRGFGKIGVLGTRFLMEGPVYADMLASKGLEHVIPESEQRLEVNDTIFNELVFGRFTGEARQRFNRIIAGLAEKGCDAVVLGCTEIPLLVDESSPLPTLDSTRLLARAALNAALV
ncbi:MAG: amino acid racemase [Pseudomonadota bacterium]